MPYASGTEEKRIDQPASAPVNMHVLLDAERGQVRLDFDRPITSVSMTPEAARALVQALRAMANDVERMSGKRDPMGTRAGLPRLRAAERRRW